MQSETDWRSLYPFASHFKTLDAGRYHFLDEGEGEPLVMVHGNPTWSFYWRNLVTAFRDRYRVVVPDHLGCGLSDKPPVSQFPYRLQQHIDNLVALLEELDLRQVTLLVHDWGGAIGLGAALQVPRRIARLVLFNTAAFPPPFIPWRIRACRLPLLGSWAVQGGNLFARAALTMAVARPLPPAVARGLVAPYDSWSHRVAVRQFVADIPASQRHPTWATLERIESQLATLQDRPVQMIWGMRDWCFRPVCLERLLTHFPAAEVTRLEDASHYVIEDAHERIIPLVDQFLQSHPAALTPPSNEALER